MQALILGGARSGKSRYAEQLATQSQQEVIYIATATANDKEMQARIQQHQLDRPTEWQTLEEPLKLAEALQAQARPNRLLLVDCLTLWMTNLLCREQDTSIPDAIANILRVLENLPGQVILVSNEVGQGVIPMGELTRRFVDETGRLHQGIAAQVDHVVLMVAGLPLTIKGEWK